MPKFVKLKLSYVNDNGVKEPKSITELITVNVKDKKHCKLLKLIDTGTKAKSRFIESLEVSLVEKKFCQNCLTVFQVLVTHLKSKLPLESIKLKNCAYLDAQKKGNKESSSAISNLTIKLPKPLEVVLCKVFQSCSIKEEVCNKVPNEWRVYQMEVLPESTYMTDTTKKSSKKKQIRRQPSYWDKAFELADLQIRASYP